MTHNHNHTRAVNFGQKYWSHLKSVIWGIVGDGTVCAIYTKKPT